MSNRLFIATRKGLFVAKQTASATPGWKISDAHFLADNVGLVSVDPRDGSIYATLDHGHFGAKLHRSTDGGQSWPEITTPAYPPKSDDMEYKDGWGKVIPWKLEKIWALEPGHPSESGTLWCGTIPGGLFHSHDHGHSWKFIQSLWDHPLRQDWFGGGADLPGIHSICVDPRDARRITLGVSCGGVWVSKDGGQSWDCRSKGMFAEYMPPERAHDGQIQDPHRVTQCRDQPDYFWAQHHNGIFRTTDNCATWHDVSNITPSSFGFAVAVHPQDPDTAWFVPGIKDEKRIPPDGQLRVARTVDGGRTYELLRNGLPQEHAYDITFRHALVISPDGSTLAFGSTTGSLWISEDQGDSWQAVSEHLPPIYCLRFDEAR